MNLPQINAKTHPFKEVHLNGHVPTTPMQDFQSSAVELDKEEEQLAQQLEELAQRRAVNNHLLREQKTDRRSQLIKEAQDWRDMAHQYRSEPDTAKHYIERARQAEAEAAQLSVDLGIAPDVQPVVNMPKNATLLSSNKAMGIVGVLFGLCLLITMVLGSQVMANPNNTMGQSMVMNSPLRVMLAFTLTFLTVLVGFLFLRLFFPQLYRIWHNRVESERSFDSLVQEAPAGYLLLGILGLLALFMSVFSGYYQALYV